jgi:hypothetical protein
VRYESDLDRRLISEPDHEALGLARLTTENVDGRRENADANPPIRSGAALRR